MATNEIPRTVADFETQLSTAISVGATTFSLSSATDDDDVALPSGRYCFTVDNGSSNKEYLIGDLSGTSVTSAVSVSRQGAESVGAVRTHRVGASVIITDFAVIQRVADILRGALTLDGSAPLAYDSQPSLSSQEQLATVGYVLGIVSGGTVNFDNQIVGGTAGETLVSPNLIYFKPSDQRWWKVDADDTTTFDQRFIGVAQGSATAGNAVSVLLSGIATNFSGLTPGSDYYASNTAGDISTSEGTYSVLVGTAVSATSLFFDGGGKDAPTFYEKQALAGTFGVPSSINKYITERGISNGTTDQSQTTQNATTALGESDATGKRVKLAQAFIPTDSILKSVNLNKQADTGSFVGTVTISIQADSAGAPSGVALATKTITSALWLVYPTGDFLVQFSTELAVTTAATYWIVIETSTTSDANHPNLGTNSAGGYASGLFKRNNTTDGWVTVSGVDLYFKTNEGFGLKALQATSTGFLPTQAIKGAYKVGIASSATVVHGLGKVPSLIEAWKGNASTQYGAFAYGVYDVANNAYALDGFQYNEAASGAPAPSTSAICYTFDTTSTGTTVTVTAVDENVVVFSNAYGGGYKIVA
jgi:hypothetical protein